MPESVVSLPSPPRLSDAVCNWVHRSRGFAAPPVQSGSSYRVLQQAFMFFYGRKLLASNHTVTGAAAAAAADHTTVLRWLRMRTSRNLNDVAERALSSWAAMLAHEGATHRECRTVFSLTVFLTALEACDGNRCAAARQLKLHRNTLFLPELRKQLAAVAAEGRATERKAG